MVEIRRGRSEKELGDKDRRKGEVWNVRNKGRRTG